MDKVKKKLAFGCMRLPMTDGAGGEQIVDEPQFIKMIDRFIEEGFNYFDTAHGYIGGQSETAIRSCLTSRYPREAYLLTDKLTDSYFDKEEDIRPFFEDQLKWCGVDYFDFYLMHAQNAGNYDKYKRCRAYETAFELKAEGKIRHVGISFHDTADVLERILTDYPEIEVVQIQFNYLDYNDLLDELHGGSPASYAIRFAAGFDGMLCVLSGMSSIEQLEDNISYMKDFKPLDERELDAVNNVVEIIHSKDLIPCTACRYCVEGCPKKISIPDLFSCMNTKELTRSWNADFYYDIHTENGGKASDCIKCGKCEKICPQHLPIRKLLESVSKEFDRKE